MRRAPKKAGHNRGPQLGTVANNRSAHHRPPPRSRANEETWLIHYDDTRVGSSVMRQGPMEPESSLLFSFASRLPEDLFLLVDD
jgi:hypothetical protein